MADNANNESNSQKRYRILAVHGSMRKGNTYALAKGILDRLAAKPDVEIVEFSVAELDLPFCCSCHTCFTKGEEYCPHYDTLSDVTAALADCDGVIFSGTAYMWALNAAMKNFLDHFAYMFHRPSLFGKKGMVLATSAGAGEKSVVKYLKTVLGQWGVNGTMVVTSTAKERDLTSPKKQTAKLDIAAERFYRMLQSKNSFAPSMKSIAIHNTFRALSLSEFSASERDTLHWNRSGFADKAYPVKTGVGKYLFGAMVHGAVTQSTKVNGRVYKKSLANKDD
jgi:multimeric flavodoxin WrbA